jgi:hypothetical protein
MADEENTMSDEDFANMSDEDFSNIDIMPEAPQEEEELEVETAQTPEEEAEEDDTSTEDEEDPADINKGESEEDDPDADPADTPEDTATTEEDDTPGSEVAEDGPKAGEEGFDYKAAYETMMKPFKANGKVVNVESPDELVQLAQMGANYTKKMQGLQPHLKTVRMLQNHGVMDEQKLSYLIDLDKRDPAAIHKLIKDSGIDPMDIDTSADSSYRSKDRRVTDEEYRFTSTLEEVASNPAGKEVVALINSGWDRKSKDAIWADPNIMRVLTSQKESGVFDQITTEIERRQTLGKLQGVAFIQAYKDVGEEMTQAGSFKAQATDENKVDDPSQKSTQRVVKTSTAKRNAVSNNDKVKAASTPKSTPAKKAKEDFNPLSMTDEEFEKQYASSS